MRFFAVCLMTVVAVVACLLRQVELRHRQVSISYEISKATQRQQALEEQLERLRIDRAALLEPSRVERIGRKWGLRLPNPDDVVVLRFSPTVASNVTGEANDGSP